jgi:hypothetical protein
VLGSEDDLIERASYCTTLDVHIDAMRTKVVRARGG